VNRVATLCALAVLTAGSAAACTNDVGSSGDQGYVAGKGIITSLPAADRKAPADVSGTTLDGKRLDLADYRGRVVVVNVWGSWCPPCRAEAPMLADAARDLTGHDVAFVGIDTRDPSRTAAQAFARNQRMPYPSIYDQSGRTLLAFRGTLTPNAIPSTLVIDPRGRVAGSVLGQITRTTLEDLVQDAGGHIASTGGIAS
jgi:thiol-disulfide isomerase/thioredoxin